MRSDQMLIETYDLEVFTPPCDPGAERFSAKGKLLTDIREALPYLNATLSGAVYQPQAQALAWRKAGHSVMIRSSEIAVSNVPDRDGAIKELDGIIKLINQTWERRAEITPNSETRQQPTVMAVYRLLPQANCKECSQPTCWTFALKFVASQKTIDDCPRLLHPQYAKKLAALREIVIEAPTLG
jgi:ArsR family metal-binding transcriptional regulator